MSRESGVSPKQIERYSVYLKYLVVLKKSGTASITSQEIASEVGCSEETVRKDLQALGGPATPGQKRSIDRLIFDMEEFLGYHEVKNVIVVGCGQLGRALLSYSGFGEYGINVVAGFDIDPSLTGKRVAGIEIYDIGRLEETVRKHSVTTAVLATKKHCAQELADRLTAAGIRAIYNFVPLYLLVDKKKVSVENIDIASSIAFLSRN